MAKVLLGDARVLFGVDSRLGRGLERLAREMSCRAGLVYLVMVEFLRAAIVVRALLHELLWRYLLLVADFL